MRLKAMLEQTEAVLTEVSIASLCLRATTLLMAIQSAIHDLFLVQLLSKLPSDCFSEISSGDAHTRANMFAANERNVAIA